MRGYQTVRPPRAKGSIRIVFETADALRNWLNSGVPLPSPLRLKTLGDRRGPRIEDSSFTQFVAQPAASLHGSGFFVYFQSYPPHRAEMTVYELTGAKLARSGFDVLRFFSDRGMRFGCAALDGENQARNLFKQAVRGFGGATSTIGRNCDQYVPGLYWLNYYSRAFAQQHNLNPSDLANATGGELIELTHGCVLRLYQSPGDWIDHEARMAGLLAVDRRFFSLLRIPPATNLGPREILLYLRHLGDQWP